MKKKLIFAGRVYKLQNMYRKAVILLFFIGVWGLRLYAQQEMQFTQYWANKISFNPGYMGTENKICVGTMYRNQWMGFKENNNKVNPESFTFSIHSLVNPLRGGLGAFLYTDKLGYEQNIGARLGYAYRVSIQGGYLGIGLMGGFLNKKIDFSKFNPLDQGDPLLSSQGIKSAMTFDLSFGLYYQMPQKFYAGISASQLLQSAAKLDVNVSPKLKRHYYITGGYEYALPSNPSFVFVPSVLVKTDFASAQYDFNTNVVYNEKFWGGLSYRVQDAIAINLGLQPMENLYLGYSYDLTTSQMGKNGRSSGSHELYLKYCFKIKVTKYQDSYRNVRFM